MSVPARRWLLLLLLLLAVPALRALAEEPWEAETRREVEEEDRLLETARRRGTTRQVVGKYASRLDRQPSALNHFLLGRALYYDGDEAGAERHLLEALRLEPRFWFARLRLAMLETTRKNSQVAEQHLAEVLRVQPRDRDALRLLATLRLEAKDWDGALRALEALLAQDPESLEVRRNIAWCHMQKDDWAAALSELRILRGRMPNDSFVRWFYALALFNTSDYKEASRELEALARLDPEDVRVLDLLRVAYGRQEDWKGVERTLERLVALVPEGEDRTQMQRALEELKAGRIPTRGGSDGAGAETEWKRDPFAELVEACMDPNDVERRREALQTYYESKVALIPITLARRIHPEVETDPTCRKWLLRIMGGLRNASLAQVVAHALFDPELGVRVLAAETLGEIGTRSGLLYLLPFFLGEDLGDAPTDAQVQEVNAARAALIRLAGRPDEQGGAEVWVPGPRLAAAKLDWQRWLAGPDGVKVRLEAIADMERQGEVWPELFLIEDVLDPEPQVSRAAYAVLRARADQPSEDALAKEMWPRFPRVPDEQLGDEDLPRLRAAVKAWWEAWRAARRAGSAKSGG